MESSAVLKRPEWCVTELDLQVLTFYLIDSYTLRKKHNLHKSDVRIHQVSASTYFF